MPDEPADNETVFDPTSERDGVRRVAQERTASKAAPDHSGRDPEGPKTAKFNPDDIPDGDVAAAAGSSPGPRVAGKVDREGKREDSTLKRFLET